MSALQEFPRYAPLAPVHCFNCGALLLALLHEPSGYARGAYRRSCDECRMFTFYDLEETP